jgi:hypothetical protein
MGSILEAGAEPPVAGSSVEVPAGTVEAPVGAVEAPPPFKEKKVGLLQLEVSRISSHTPPILRHGRSPPPFVLLSGRRRPSPTLRLSRC